MNDLLTGKLDLFGNNLGILNKEFKNEDFHLKRTGALFYTFNEKEANVEDIRKSLGIIRKRYKLTSPFRSSVKNILTYKLIDHEFDLNYLDKLEEVYKKITVKWKTPLYKALISLIIVENNIANIDGIITKTNAIYQDMKEKHRGVTSDNDYLMAFLLSLKNDDKEKITEDVEKAYDLMKNKIKSKNVTQYLSHVLTLLDGDYHTKTNMVLNIQDTFIEKKRKLGVVGLSAIGLFASFNHSAEEITELLLELEKQLKQTKGFRYIGKNTRICYASYLLYDIFKEKDQKKEIYILKLLAISVMISTINSLKIFSAIQ